MRIGIIGTGHMGGTLARLFVDRGHEVAVSNSRGPESLGDVVSDLGANARAVTPVEAAQFGEVVVVSIPFGRYTELPTDGLDGKVVVDTTNYPGRDGNYPELDEDKTTSSELIQQHLSEARVVKAFNSIKWEDLRDRGRPADDAERTRLRYSGDDAEAKATVAGLIDAVGFNAVDAGSLAEGRAQASAERAAVWHISTNRLPSTFRCPVASAGIWPHVLKQQLAVEASSTRRQHPKTWSAAQDSAS